jgi:hypothetical protein
MNAREKASELIVNFQLKCKTLDYQEAKQCALMAVEEILNSRPLITDSQVEYNNFWNDVKSELQSL